jgi:phosphomevalonate kinase
MIARAPGKLVLSGAYAVLEGAPALVAAIDRYAVADASRPTLRVTPEVREALVRRGALWLTRRIPWTVACRRGRRRLVRRDGAS